MRVSVLIPTFRRPQALEGCLAALSRLSRPADEVLVVTRPDDLESAGVLARRSAWPVLRVVHVHRPGVIAAMNAGWAASTGDVVALTDDDAAPHADWLERIVARMTEEKDLGAIGGRDLIGGRREGPHVHEVGQLTWYGRMRGGHHLGMGPARRVDFLKGVNMAVRRAAVGEHPFDERLHGAGAQVHWELSLCLALSRAGWGIEYDPTICVDHFPAVRHDADQRGKFDRGAEIDRVHNETIVLAEHLPLWRRAAYHAYMGWVGTRENVGLLQALRLRLRRDRQAWARLQAGRIGRRLGRRAAHASFSPRARPLPRADEVLPPKSPSAPTAGTATPTPAAAMAPSPRITR